ncbi:hypothetical protein GCM10009555_009240 [Acrocarpospora macrocephala]|uniref:ABC transporter permease n=1 Tax=Acrocarpospora macrocephala TaxID=150177 RepID=A0A5M3WME5_9ACTN|nr:ABC transporter permease subunit [Acrocarpospora macrocephala]GES10457.1 hypothetical protein Amac_040540 [Acrocarpospora macrocephala]
MTGLLRGEWTKFRTVRGWVLGMALAVLITVLLGVFTASGSHSSCSGPEGDVCPALPVGPEGLAVNDRFSFAHQPLAGDGSVTARVASLTGIITYPPPDHDKIVPGVVPWAKAGIMIKESVRPGSAYAAMMLTGGHGARMQHNYEHDVAGSREARWLRLTRSGDTITGAESADGTHWTTVSTVRLTGLQKNALMGLFVASPCDLTVTQGDLGGTIGKCRLTQATAVFDHVSLAGNPWTYDDLGGHTGAPALSQGTFRESGGTFTMSGSGDVGPYGIEGGQIVERTLSGAYTGLIVVIVVAVMFITAEYRRGLIRTTLLASPRRGRVLVAKSLVIGVVTFVVGLIAAVIAVPLCSRILRANGNQLLPVSTSTELRVVAGTAALLAVAAVLALAIGALIRRSAVAVITAIAVIVVPHVLTTASVLPAELSQWLLRVTPAAAFAIQQSIPEYSQVEGHYVPQMGYYPLAPWAGFAVLCAYALLALGLAVLLLRRRDA